MKSSCDWCGREKDPEDLIQEEKARICFICKTNQYQKPRGKEIKGDKFKNSQFSK